MSKNIRGGFTLVELLIVVAIIAILAAMAAPNLLEAQTRSKVSAIRAGMRTVELGLESYYVDHNFYPPTMDVNDQVMDMGGMMRMPFVPNRLTTPIAYLTNIPLDNFNPKVMPDHKHTYIYMSHGNTSDMARRNYRAAVDEKPAMQVHTPRYVLYSTGPDTSYGAMMMQTDMGPPPQYMVMMTPGETPVHYDPSNGTISPGDIVHFAR